MELEYRDATGVLTHSIIRTLGQRPRGRELDYIISLRRGGWSRFSRNVRLIIAHHIQCIVFADSAG